MGSRARKESFNLDVGHTIPVSIFIAHSCLAGNCQGGFG